MAPDPYHTVSVSPVADRAYLLAFIIPHAVLNRDVAVYLSRHAFLSRIDVSLAPWHRGKNPRCLAMHDKLSLWTPQELAMFIVLFGRMQREPPVPASSISRLWKPKEETADADLPTFYTSDLHLNVGLFSRDILKQRLDELGIALAPELEPSESSDHTGDPDTTDDDVKKASKKSEDAPPTLEDYSAMAFANAIAHCRYLKSVTVQKGLEGGPVVDAIFARCSARLVELDALTLEAISGNQLRLFAADALGVNLPRVDEPPPAAAAAAARSAATRRRISAALFIPEPSWTQKLAAALPFFGPKKTPAETGVGQKKGTTDRHTLTNSASEESVAEEPRGDSDVWEPIPLRELTLTRIPGAVDAIAPLLERFAVRGALTSLTLEGMQVSKDVVPVLSQQPSLLHLTLKNLTLTGADFSLLPSRLVSLSLRSSNFTAHDFLTIAKGGFRHMTALNVSHCGMWGDQDTPVNDATVRVVVPTLPALTTVWIARSDQGSAAAHRLALIQHFNVMSDGSW